MKLWLLKLVEAPEPRNPWDCAFGFVVRAKDEDQARLLALMNHGDETEFAWRDPKQTTCVELTAEGEAEMIIRDYCNG